MLSEEKEDTKVKWVKKCTSRSFRIVLKGFAVRNNGAIFRIKPFFAFQGGSATREQP